MLVLRIRRMNQPLTSKNAPLRRDKRQFLVVTPTYFVLNGRNSLQVGSHSLVLPSGDDVTLKLTILLYFVRRANDRLRNARYLHVKHVTSQAFQLPADVT